PLARHEPARRQRFHDALSWLAYASRVGIGKKGIATVLESFEGSAIAEKIGTRFMRERLAKVIPFVGALSGGALNFMSVRAVGRAAIRLYDSLIVTDVGEGI